MTDAATPTEAPVTLDTYMRAQAAAGWPVSPFKAKVERVTHVLFRIEGTLVETRRGDHELHERGYWPPALPGPFLV